MDKRYKWSVYPKPNYSDLPYPTAYLPYRGAVAGGGVPYYIHSPHANKNFSRLQHGYHTGTSRPNKYHKPPPIGGPSENAYTGRRTGGAPPSGGASSNSSDVVTLIVDNKNLKRLIVLHVNMLQEQSDKLAAKDKEIEEHNLKINKLFAQNDELTRTQARLEAELIEARSQLRRKQQRDDHHKKDNDDDDDDDLPRPPAKIVRHVETQTDFDWDVPEPKRLKAINAHQEIAEQNQLYLQQQRQREQQKSQAEECLVAEQVRPEPQPTLAQLMRQSYDNQPHMLPLSNANQVSNVLVTSVTNLSPATPIDPRSKVGRAEFNGKKVSTMILHRVNQDSSLTTTSTTTIISSNHIEKLDQMPDNQAEEEVQMKAHEQEHETSKVEMLNDKDPHEIEIVSETIVGAEEEVVEEVVEEEVIHEDTEMVEEHVLQDQSTEKEHNVDEQLVVEEKQLEQTAHIENDLAKEKEKLVEEQMVETEQSIEHNLTEKEQIVDERLVEKEGQVVEEQLVEEEQVVVQEQEMDHQQVVEEQVVEEQVVEEQMVEEHVLEEQVVEEQVVEEQVVEEQVVEDQLLEDQVGEEHEIHTTDANGHMELDEEEEIKVNNVDVHSPYPGDKHQIFVLNATDSPSAHSTPNHQLKKQLQIAEEEDQQQEQLVQDGQVEMEVSTLEYFSDDGTQEEFEIHSEQVVTINTQTEETEISNDFRISPTATNDTQTPNSLSVPAPSTPPPAPQIYNQAASKINSLAVAPNSKKVKKPALSSKIIANHQTEIKAHHLDLQEPLKKILKLKLRQCVLPTKSTTSPAQQDKVTNFTHLSNDNHEISIEEQTRRKLQEHLEKQQRRQSQTPLVLLKKKSSDEVSNTSLIFPPTATTITPAPTPITTPSTTPIHTPTSSIESAVAAVVAPPVVAPAAVITVPPTKSVTKTEEKSTQSHIAAPLTPQSMSSVSSSTSTSTTTSNRKTPNNLHQTYGKTKTRSITTGGFLEVSYPYTTRSWEDQDIHCDNEFFLEEADELLADNPSLEIPKWHDTPVPASSDSKDIEPLSDADFVKRHEKYVKDEIERKRRDERFLREQIRSQELRMRHKQDEVLLPLDPLPISTFYPLPEDIEGVQFVNEVPVQVFGDNMPTLNPNDEFNLPWIEEETANTAIARAKAQAKPVSTLANKKLPTTAAEQKHQELNSSFVFIKRRKRRKAGKSGVFGGT
ncbi:protein male-specific lethal-1 [Drosophila tropicalis]|uniref:protein male-specific lethal-1 n=1 Tax=Drosophila tropicalis TaxID=46794 RepID=UPI0035AC1087